MYAHTYVYAHAHILTHSDMHLKQQLLICFTFLRDLKALEEETQYNDTR